MASTLKVKSTFDFRRFKGASEKAFNEGLEKGAMQLLDWSANGSSKVPDKPPIRWGVLRASGSVFVGKKLIGTTEATSPPSQGTPTPNKTYNGKKKTITLGYNATYATKQHEEKLNPGPFSQQSGNSRPGNQWVTKHLFGDGSLLMAMIALILKKRL